ncbi:unnamed protein product, partial [marine sediment metagenome]
KGKKRGWYTQSIPISFSDKDVLAKEKDAIPKTGKSYKSDNVFISYVSKIAYTVYDKEGQPSIWLINEDGTDKELFRENAYSPAWSPDGKKIAYVQQLWDFDEEMYEFKIRIATSDGLSDKVVLTEKKFYEFYVIEGIENVMPVLLNWSSDNKGIFFQLTIYASCADAW